MAGETAPLPTFNQPQQGIPLIPSQQYPARSGVSQGGGTGGLVDRNKIINDAVQNSLNQTQQIREMQRDQQSYNEEQARKKAAANASGVPVPDAATAPDHGGFMDSVLHGLSSLGSGIKSIFGGAPGAPQGGIPAANAAAAAEGPPAPAQAAPQGPPQMAQVQPQMDGGVVSPPQGTVPQFQKPLPSVLAFATGGAIPAGPQSGFGVRDGGAPGIRGFEDGGTIPNDPNMAAASEGPPSPMHPAVAQAHLSQIIDDLHGDMHAHALGDDDQPNHSRAIPVETITPSEAKQRKDSGGYLANGDPAPQAAMVDNGPSPQATPAPPAAPQGASPQAGPQGPAPTAQGAAGSQGGIPDPSVAATAASVQAVQNAPANDPAKTGVQTTSPGKEGKPHSITPETWDKWDQNIDKAVSLAAIAGHDPGQVRQALEANRNAYIQGHVLRYLSSANVAMQNGDKAGVEKALKNMYYYTPDGQDLQIQKDKNGNLMYQDPVNPTKLDGNNVSQPNMIPVDSAHLQMLGQAFLDPMQVNRTIMEIRSSQAIAQLKQAQAKGALDTGQGNLMRGEASIGRANNQGRRVDSQNYKDLAEGDAARTRASALSYHLRNLIHQNKLDPQLIGGAKAAGEEFEKQVQGQLTTVPTETKDPKTGAMIPNLSPGAGHSMRDSSKSSMPGASPEDIVAGKALAGEIFAGSGGTKSVPESARLATLAMQARKGSHPGPDGKPMRDFMTDPKTGDTHVWNKATKSWEAFRLPLTSAQNAAGGKLGVTADDLDSTAQAEMASNGGIPSGGAGASTDEDDQPNAPDMQAASVPEDG